MIGAGRFAYLTADGRAGVVISRQFTLECTPSFATFYGWSLDWICAYVILITVATSSSRLAPSLLLFPGLCAPECDFCLLIINESLM
jgi:hypothetical protein